MGAYPTIRLGSDAPLPLPTNAFIGQWTFAPSTSKPTQVNALVYIAGDGNAAHFARGDGTFATPPTFGASGGSHSVGYVPDPGSSSGSTRFLREDATWAVPSGSGGTSGASTSLRSAKPCYFIADSSGVRTTGIGGTSTIMGSTFTTNFGGTASMAPGGEVRTSGVAGSLAGYYHSTSDFRTGNSIQCQVVMAVNTRVSSDIRWWVGMTTGGAPTTTFGGSDSPATVKYACFRFSSTASDVHFQCICSDGTSTTIVDSGITPVVSTSYRFGIVCDDVGGSVKFYINGSLVATISTHLPGTAGDVMNTFGGVAETSTDIHCIFNCIDVWSSI